LSVALAFARARRPTRKIKFEKYTLPNGLTVILSEDHRLPQVAVDAVPRRAGQPRRPARSGFAHLFRAHDVLRLEARAALAVQVLESIGASGVNGTTAFDRTNYFEVVPSSQLAAALWVESDRMGYLLDTLDEKKLRVQRDVVSNEKSRTTTTALTALRGCASAISSSPSHTRTTNA